MKHTKKRKISEKEGTGFEGALPVSVLVMGFDRGASFYAFPARVE